MGCHRVLFVLLLSLALPLRARAAVHVAVRCPSGALFGLTAGDGTNRSSMHADGKHRVEDTASGDFAELDCDTGCGSTGGEGACIAVGTAGDAKAEAAFERLSAGGWAHQRQPGVSTRAAVDVKCGDDWFRLEVPSGSGEGDGSQTNRSTTRLGAGKSTTTTTTVATRRDFSGGDQPSGDEAGIDCTDANPSLRVEGDVSAVCCTCYSPTPCGKP